MAWVNFVAVVGDPTKALDINTVQANITAQANGDPGAPQNTKASMAADSIGQTQLDTSIGTVGVGNNGVNVALPGGEYGFWPKNTVDDEVYIGSFRGSDTTATDRSIYGIYQKTGTIAEDFSQRYMDASPPYNIGDGDIANFTFVLLGSTGEIKAIYSAPTPPWAYNGPTNITPTRTARDDNGILRKYRTVVKSRPTPPWEGGDVEAWEKGPDTEEIEITQDVKNADMARIPHPFGNIDAGDKVIMLEPHCTLTENLSGMIAAGENVNAMIREGHIELGDQVECCAPNGVIAVKPSWKNTGS